ncbi:MAG: phosphoesterase, partial [Eudoraea sp.]|nr:phosphoesterase [Eudoraea sp.]
MHLYKHLYLCVLLLLFVNCATYKTKYETPPLSDRPSAKEVSHTFYLIGDAGLSPIRDLNPALKIFRDQLNTATKNSTAIFLGDNIYPAGLPDKKDSTIAYKVAKNHLDAQLATLTNFKGHPIFIPGNHDWYNEGLVGLKRQQKYIEKKIDKKNVFLPEGGCPIEEEEISDDILLVTIDSEWFLTNWDKHPTINDGCDIKSREAFFEEIESIIKKNRTRTTVIAIHHPMFTYGSHNGLYAFKKNIFPLNETLPIPIIGSLINVIRRTSGASMEDLQNSRYTALRKRLVTLAQFSDRVIFTSGHEHTLQYIVEENTPQIVSGSGAKKGYTRLLNGSKFSTGHQGFATLEIYKDGSSKVRFFGLDENENEKFLFASDVLSPFRDINEDKYPEIFPSEVEASVYTEEEIDKSGFYRTIWGDRYRSYYGTKVKVPTVRIDTLFGGLVPVRKGGGHQSKSLRLRHKNGKEYVMRALRKSAELYLQSMAFKEQYIVGDFENTYTEDILSDFYTGAHPYAPFTIGPLSDAVGLFHTNPVLYYVPKQPALEEFNKTFGNELYMIEEHAGDGHGDLESFGFSNELKSTESMLEDLR